MSRFLIIEPRTGIAGDMTCAALFHLLIQLKGEKTAMNFLDSLKGKFQSVVKKSSFKVIPYGNKGYQLHTSIEEDILAYDKVISLVKQLNKILELPTNYQETALKVVKTLIDAESFVHSYSLTTDPKRWNPDSINFKFLISKKEKSTAAKKKEDQIIFRPIGYASTPYKTAAPYQPMSETSKQHDVPQKSSKIILLPQYASGLHSLSQFTHIYVLSYLDRIKSPSELKPWLIFPPWTSELNTRGVFASRSPQRPNSIGLSVVKLLDVEDNQLIIDNIDLLDDTPILDIKPYICSLDSKPESNDGWVDNQEHLLLHQRGIPHEHKVNESGHLHEASDIIIDSVVPLVLLAELGVPLENINLIPPIFLGDGKISFSHGNDFKIPVPAVKYLIDKYSLPAVQGPVNKELTTPTGAALLSALELGSKERHHYFTETNDFMLTSSEVSSNLLKKLRINNDDHKIFIGKGFGLKKIEKLENALYMYLIEKK